MPHCNTRNWLAGYQHTLFFTQNQMCRASWFSWATQLTTDTSGTCPSVYETAQTPPSAIINMHHREEMRFRLMLFMGLSIYCHLGCASQLRVPSRKKIEYSLMISAYEIISLRNEGIQALPEDIFMGFGNVTVSLKQTYCLTTSTTTRF